MPEGPEVETVRRTLAPLVEGAVLGRARVSRLKLRTPVTSQRFRPLEGGVIAGVHRHGKLLWLDVTGVGTGARGLWVRLGMTGQLTVADPTTTPPPHTHVRLPLTTRDGAARELRYTDPRRFGEVVPFTDLTDLDTARADLGPDGLALSDVDKATVAAALRQTSRAIKEALLDQRLVAGVGNIYAAEACFIAGLDPRRAGTSLSVAQARALTNAVAQTLHDGVARRGTSFSNYVDATGERGDNASYLLVFQREGEPCRRCGGTVERLVQGARSTFWCPSCQR